MKSANGKVQEKKWEMKSRQRRHFFFYFMSLSAILFFLILPFTSLRGEHGHWECWSIRRGLATCKSRISFLACKKRTSNRYSWIFYPSLILFLLSFSFSPGFTSPFNCIRQRTRIYDSEQLLLYLRTNVSSPLSRRGMMEVKGRLVTICSWAL